MLSILTSILFKSGNIAFICAVRKGTLVQWNSFGIAETPDDGRLGPKHVVRRRSDRNSCIVYEIRILSLELVLSTDLDMRRSIRFHVLPRDAVRCPQHLCHCCLLHVLVSIAMAGGLSVLTN
jgi:hypothetical protein